MEQFLCVLFTNILVLKYNRLLVCYHLKTMSHYDQLFISIVLCNLKYHFHEVIMYSLFIDFEDLSLYMYNNLIRKAFYLYLSLKSNLMNMI